MVIATLGKIGWSVFSIHCQVLLQRDELQLLPQEIGWFVGFRDLAPIPLSRGM